MSTTTEIWMRSAKPVLRCLAFALFFISLGTAGTLLICAAFWTWGMRPSIDFTVGRDFSLWAGLAIATLNLEAWLCFRTVIPRLNRSRDLWLVMVGTVQGLVVLLAMAGQHAAPTSVEYVMGFALLLGSMVVLDIVRRSVRKEASRPSHLALDDDGLTTS